MFNLNLQKIKYLKSLIYIYYIWELEALIHLLKKHVPNASP